MGIARGYVRECPSSLKLQQVFRAAQKFHQLGNHSAPEEKRETQGKRVRGEGQDCHFFFFFYTLDDAVERWVSLSGEQLPAGLHCSHLPLRVGALDVLHDEGDGQVNGDLPGKKLDLQPGTN